jgi:hypothetical protein
MQPIRTEELLARARQASQEGNTTALVPLIDGVLATTHETWQKFVLTATEDPEMPAEVREAIAKGLEDYLDSLGKMKEAAQTDNGPQLSEAASEAEKCVQAVRSAQDVHKANLAQGPTPFPYLNRLLIQYEAVRQGGDSQRLLALLVNGTSFLIWLRKELACRAATPADTQSVFHLQQFLEALQAAVESHQALPEVEDDIVDLATQLATALAEPPLGSDGGPTSLPAVNGVLGALAECSGEVEEFEFLLSFMDQCRNSLRGLVPISSPTDTVSKLDSVLGSLDRMEHALRHASDFEELVTAAGELEVSGNALGDALSAGQATSFVDQTEGMPVFFRSILEPAYQFLNGQGDADTVFAASEHLESSATDMQRQAGGLDAADPRMDPIQETLELMNEASGMLREVATSANPKGLEIATALLFQAAEQISNFNG